jgi:hypothetical protein
VREFACNYAIARFRPYRETGEFVNVGIVLLCPALGFFDCVFETRKHKRVTDFFPELDFLVFQAGLSGLLKELSRVTSKEAGQAPQLVFTKEAEARVAIFKELVRPREGIFHFGEVGTVLAAEPRAKLEELFNYYIKRQFARDREYQEIIMRRRLAEYLQKMNLARFYKQDQHIGNESYNVILPFVHFEGETARKAIKPLHLDKPLSTEIYRHGDAWIATVRRLRQMNRLPQEVLFAVKHPKHLGTRDKRQDAAKEICTELEKLETVTLHFDDTESIAEFAECEAQQESVPSVGE